MRGRTDLADEDMYGSQAARHPAQTLAVNGQYLPPPYDFSGYHHHVPGLGEPSASAWNPVYAPRDEYSFTFPSPGGAQVAFSPPDVSGTPTAGGGPPFGQYTFSQGQDPFSARRRSPEAARPAASGQASAA